MTKKARGMWIASLVLHCVVLTVELVSIVRYAMRLPYLSPESIADFVIMFFLQLLALIFCAVSKNKPKLAIGTAVVNAVTFTYSSLYSMITLIINAVTYPEFYRWEDILISLLFEMIVVSFYVVMFVLSITYLVERKKQAKVEATAQQDDSGYPMDLPQESVNDSETLFDEVFTFDELVEDEEELRIKALNGKYVYSSSRIEINDKAFRIIINDKILKKGYVKIDGDKVIFTSLDGKTLTMTKIGDNLMSKTGILYIKQ